MTVGARTAARSILCGMICRQVSTLLSRLDASASRRTFFHWPLATNPSPGMVLRAQPLG